MSARKPKRPAKAQKAPHDEVVEIRDKIDEAANGKIADVSDELRCLAALLTAASGEEADIRLCDVGQIVASLQDRLQDAKDEIEEEIVQLGAVAHRLTLAKEVLS